MRRCPHTRLWIHPCKRPSSCASRRRLQSARAETDRAESIPSRLESLPRELPSLEMPGPVWADLDTQTHPRAARKGCWQGQCLTTFLVYWPIDRPDLEFLRVFLASLVFQKQRLQGEPKFMNLQLTCCFLTESICPGIPGHCCSTQLHEPCYFIASSYRASAHVHVFLDLVLLVFFPNCFLVLSFIFLSPSPSVPSYSSPPNMTAPPAAQDFGGLEL